MSKSFFIPPPLHVNLSDTISTKSKSLMLQSNHRLIPEITSLCVCAQYNALRYSSVYYISNVYKLSVEVTESGKSFLIKVLLRDIIEIFIFTCVVQPGKKGYRICLKLFLYKFLFGIAFCSSFYNLHLNLETKQCNEVVSQCFLCG